ncbi:hypothetical protein E2C01_004906 [Portunus trituberculatus]|uniref:Uncharacterized protein n=1 Tax=Portunus trituberculatus TaxID=210409 RepID=A0A5B7CSW2_PORTR|nr:hypothetical protein [Portunus trituberculatus]
MATSIASPTSSRLPCRVAWRDPDHTSLPLDTRWQVGPSPRRRMNKRTTAIIDLDLPSSSMFRGHLPSLGQPSYQRNQGDTKNSTNGLAV